MKSFLLLVLSVLPCLLFGAEAKPIPESLPFKKWSVPPGTFVGHGVKPLPLEAPDQWNVREWFEDNGVQFSPGEEAVYDRPRVSLIVRANAGTLDLIDALGFRVCTFDVPYVVRVEVALVEFTAGKLPNQDGEIPVETLRKVAGDSWHVLNRMLLTTRNGQRAVGTFTAAKSEEKQATPPPGKTRSPSSSEDVFMNQDESGASLEVEAGLRDGNSVTVNLNYHCRAPGSLGWNWNTTTSAVVHVGVPMLVQLNSAAPDADPAQPMKLRAMILRVDVDYPWDKVIVRPLMRPSSPRPPSR